MTDKEVLEQAKKLIESKNTKPQQEVKENNKAVREYTNAELMVFNLAKKNLDNLDVALKNAITSELDCAEIIKDAQPIGDDFDKYYRIVEVISRYDGAGKHNPYEGKAPEATKKLTESIKPVNKLK